MLETFRNIWRVKDLRQKLGYTLMMLLIYRLVSILPAPGVDFAKLRESMSTIK